MTPDRETDNDPARLDEAVDRAVRAFEQHWHNDHDYRIEDLWPNIPGIIGGGTVDPNHPVTQNAILLELLKVEISLRAGQAAERINRWEYQDRFPDDETLVDQALAWFVEQGNGRTFGPGDVFRTGIGLHDKIEFETDFVVEPDARLDELPAERTVPDTLGPYAEIELIGEGGFGVVYRAVDQRDGRRVALKFPRSDKLDDDEALQLFRNEADRAMALRHDGIVATWAVEDIDGYFFIVQQLIDGTDLKKSIRERRTQKEIATLIARVADALAHANEHLVHRDLKPSNILIDQTGQPYIADFGLALHQTALLSAGKQLCGTAPYMSPEQVRGKVQNLTGRSDIWSLGVILYEMLTYGKSRPFEGRNTDQIFDQIETKEPRPLRSIDPSIDRRLQEICFKCLEKTESRRYFTADELADELRDFAEASTRFAARDDTVRDAAPPDAVFVPRGLRSYDASDHDFFLELLPGPRDASGLPASLRFWKLRICEPVLPENRIPVGVLYGPSGSGKSSFVKAGMLPVVESRENASPVVAVYVECTVGDTEVRLIRALRERFRDMPGDVSLPAALAGLAAGKWQRLPRKILIVLDQFEQRLSVGDDFRQSQLVEALRQCDGQTVQCLLSVRDDFWMALTRFADALELDLLEGRNAQAIDLFDKPHAQTILAKHGRAFGGLPSEQRDELTADQRAFIVEAVDQLAENNFVICVRLILFGEMFKHQDWSLSALKQAGQVGGVGVQFLDRELGPQNRKVPHQAVLRLLCSLLPAAGTDIRGAMKSQAELARAAGLATDSLAFKNTIAVLDGELRLITRCDPDVSGPVELEPVVGDKNPPTAREHHFQLTHDYLVPTLRAWQDKWLGDTRRGRAELRLQRLASHAVAGKPLENLPTHVEWLSWQILLRGHRFAGNERMVMQAARRRFLQQSAAAMAILLALGTLTAYLMYQNSRQQRIAQAEGLVDDLIGQEISETPGIIGKLQDHRDVAESRLRDIVNAPSRSARDRLRASMGLLPFDSGYKPTLIQAMTTVDCNPDALRAFVEILSRHAGREFETLRKICREPDADPRSRFRATCGEILLNNGRGDWSPLAEMMASVLWDEPPTNVNGWIAIMQPAGEQLAPAFSGIFADTNDASKARVLAKALFQFLPPDVRTTYFNEQLCSANDARFDAILTTIEENGDAERFAEALNRLVDNSGDDIVHTNLCLALMRLGQNQKLVELYSGDFEIPLTILAINLSTPGRIRLHSLKELYGKYLYGKYSVADSEHLNLRRSVLQALALQSPSIYDPESRNWLREIAGRHVLNDEDACCFSTCELILRRLGMDLADQAQWRCKRRERGRDGILGNVLLDHRLQAFSIIDQIDENGFPAKFAISTTETTVQDVQDFRESTGVTEPFDRPNHPFELENDEDFLFVYGLCNSLSLENGLTSKDLCYPPEVSKQNIALIPADTRRAGYRLPTVAEWRSANRSNGVLPGLTVDGKALAWNYAWVFKNSEKDQPEMVAKLLPNAAGLFDSFGNVQEICQSQEGEVLKFYEMGQTVRSNASALSATEGAYHNVISPLKNRQGVRLARTVR